MSADTPNTDTQAPEETVPVSEVKPSEAAAPEVVSQDASTVGDENLPEPREPQAHVVEEQVDHAVVQPRQPDSNVSNVYEVTVTTDEVITDPSSPLAVQVPDAGRGDATLPIHALARPRPEDVFADAAKKSD